MSAGRVPGAPAVDNAKKTSSFPAGPLMASLSNLKLPESDDYIDWGIAHPRPSACPKQMAATAAGEAAVDTSR
jgi:hypothetical protein